MSNHVRAILRRDNYYDIIKIQHAILPRFTVLKYFLYNNNDQHQLTSRVKFSLALQSLPKNNLTNSSLHGIIKRLGKVADFERTVKFLLTIIMSSLSLCSNLYGGIVMRIKQYCPMKFILHKTFPYINIPFTNGNIHIKNISPYGYTLAIFIHQQLSVTARFRRGLQLQAVRSKVEQLQLPAATPQQLRSTTSTKSAHISC